MGWNGLRADSHMSTVVSSGLELLENMHAALTYKRACLDLVSNAKESEALESMHKTEEVAYTSVLPVGLRHVDGVFDQLLRGELPPGLVERVVLLNTPHHEPNIVCYSYTNIDSTIQTVKMLSQAAFNLS